MERDGNFQTNPNYSNPQNVESNPMDFQFSPEEIKVLKECQYEALVRRGIPLALSAIGTCFVLINRGMIKKRYSSIIGSGIGGYLLGTLSYRQVCLDKMLALPNSTLKERLLSAQRFQIPSRTELQLQDGQLQNSYDNTMPSQAPISSSLDIGPYSSDSFDYSSQPNDLEAAYVIDPPLQPNMGTSYTTYDELRQRNRIQYEKSRIPGYRSPQNTNTTSLNNPQQSQYNQPNDLPLPPRRSDDFSS